MKNQRQTYQEWRDKISKFGFGVKLDIDLPFEKKGYFYNSDHYDKIYNKRWGYTNVISQAIGQGEITATPLQIANAMAVIANRGYYIKPHLIKAIGDRIKKEYVEKNYVGVDAKHFEPVIDGMQDAVNTAWGTAVLSRIPNILMCGKTGTVQNSRGKNHSVFIGFAPRDNPKIAIAVIVENAGYGSTYAAPIASYMVEKYITRQVSGARANQVEWMKNQNLLPLIIDKSKKLKLTKADSAAIKKADSTKRIQDSIRIKSATLKNTISAKLTTKTNVNTNQ